MAVVGGLIPNVRYVRIMLSFCNDVSATDDVTVDGAEVCVGGAEQEEGTRVAEDNEAMEEDVDDAGTPRRSTFLSGEQMGQSGRTQFFQWAIIWRRSVQCCTVQFLPSWQTVICLRMLFMLAQLGSVQGVGCAFVPLFICCICASRRWHL